MLSIVWRTLDVNKRTIMEDIWPSINPASTFFALNVNDFSDKVKIFVEIVKAFLNFC